MTSEPSLAVLHDAARGRGIDHYRRYSKAELSALLAGEEGQSGVRLQRDGPLAVIVLDDPQTRNALGAVMLDALDQALAGLEHDAQARLVAVTGHGGVFCSGASLREVDATRGGGERLTDHGCRVLDRLAALPVPVVALVGGDAVGGGVELALACDWRVMAPSAELRFVHASLGLLPGFGGLVRLRALVGEGAALRLVATCATLTGAEAVAAGLADATIVAAAQRGYARTLAGAVAAADPVAVTQAKVVLRAGTRAAERAAFLACWPRRRIPAPGA